MSAIDAQSEQIDSRSLVEIEDLPFLARTVVHGFLAGLHRSPMLGRSSEFASYRSYIQGDDLRHVDWKVWARTDKLFIKEFDDETNLRAHFIVDSTASMGFGAPEKLAYARVAAASLGYLLLRQGDAVGLALVDEHSRIAAPAANARLQLEALCVALSNAQAAGASALDKVEDALSPYLRTGGITVLFSDLLGPIEEFESLLRGFASRDQEIVVFHILAPEERAPKLEGPTLIEDMETGATVRVAPEDFLERYQASLERHCAALREVCATFEAEFIETTTDEPLDAMLYAFLGARTTEK